MTTHTTSATAMIADHLGIPTDEWGGELPSRPLVITDELNRRYACAAAPIVLNCYKRFAHYDSNGDLAQAACDGLWKGLSSYSYHRGYLPYWVQTSVRYALRSASRKQQQTEQYRSDIPLTQDEAIAPDNVTYQARSADALNVSPHASTIAESSLAASEMLRLFQAVLSDFRSKPRTELEMDWLDEIEMRIASGDGWPSPAEWMGGFTKSDPEYIAITNISSKLRQAAKACFAEYISTD